MWKWAQGAVASVTGAAEPEYGAEAFHSIDERVTTAKANPFSALDRADYCWVQPPQSHVETQTFYFHTGPYVGFAQLIHSNPVNLAFTSQFTFSLRNRRDPKFRVWGSHRLDNAEVREGTNFAAQDFEITLDEELKTYKFRGRCGDDIQVDLSFKLEAEGCKIGLDGTSTYGTDPQAPWGTMRHIFWPRSAVSGLVAVKSANLVLDLTKQSGQGLFVMALQGMKPHHCAAKWNFLDFQGPTVSATVMMFVTPPSYGSQTSAVGAVVRNGELLLTAVNVEVAHTSSEPDQLGATWPRPTAIKFRLVGPQPRKPVSETYQVEIAGKLDHLVDRVDVMAELPSFVKRVASGLSGTQPIIYQYHDELEAKITSPDGSVYTEAGDSFTEATFISEI